MIFLALVAACAPLSGVVPVTRRPEYRMAAPELIHRTGMRFSVLGWICLGLLVLSGVFNLAYRGVTWAMLSSAVFWEGPFGRALGFKLLFVTAILGLSAAHDFYIGPRAAALWQSQPNSPEAIRLRRHASWIGRINLLLALLVVAFAVMLVRGWPG